MKFYKIMFFSSLMIGTLIAVSAYSWMSAWIGLEINLMSMIPLLKNNKNKYPSEATLKYFTVQVMASSLLLFSITLFLSVENYSKEIYFIKSIMLSSALLLKMGAAPFHFWFPEMMGGLNWNNSLIMLTWQKIAPMMLLIYQIMYHPLFFSIIITLSSMISSMQGINQICMRKIMAYSSISHMSWMISSMLNSVNIWVQYFIMYCIINMNIILIFNKFNTYFFNQLMNMFNNKKKIKLIFMLNFLSLSGLPPFMGFFPKWMTINNMVENNHYTLAVMLITFTLISLYFYLRITFPSFSMNSEESLIILFNKTNNFHFMTNLFSLMGLLLCSVMYSSL